MGRQWRVRQMRRELESGAGMGQEWTRWLRQWRVWKRAHTFNNNNEKTLVIEKETHFNKPMRISNRINKVNFFEGFPKMCHYSWNSLFAHHFSWPFPIVRKVPFPIRKKHISFTGNNFFGDGRCIMFCWSKLKNTTINILLRQGKPCQVFRDFGRCPSKAVNKRKVFRLVTRQISATVSYLKT